MVIRLVGVRGFESELIFVYISASDETQRRRKAACDGRGHLLGAVRETANLIRTQVLPDDEAVHLAAFTLCWDAIKA